MIQRHRLQLLGRGESVIVTYEISNDDGASNEEHSFFITVTGTNNDAVATYGKTATIFRDIFEDAAEGLLINQADLLGAYQDADGDTLTINNLALQDSEAGTLTLTADGNYQFTPAGNFNGIATFTYEISDGKASIQQSHFITVNPINDAPEGTSKPLMSHQENLSLSPDDFGFKDIVDRDVLSNVILDLTSFPQQPESEKQSTQSTGTKAISYADLANGLISIQGGAIQQLEIKFKVQDDKGTENGGRHRYRMADTICLCNSTCI